MTNARYFVVCVRFEYVWVVLELLMVDQRLPPFVEYSHRSTEPVWPDKVSVPPLLPVHTVMLPETVPPTETALTVTVAGAELAEEQELFITTARY